MSRLAGLGLLLGLACVGPERVGEPPAEGHRSGPDFRLRSLSGDLVRLSDLRGKVVLIAFWATWCEPCQMELAQLGPLWEELRPRGFELLGVSVDTADREAEVRRIARRSQYRFPVLLDQTSEVTDRFQPTMELPFSVLIARDGRIAARHQGYRPGDEALLHREIQALLDANP